MGSTLITIFFGKGQFSIRRESPFWSPECRNGHHTYAKPGVLARTRCHYFLHTHTPISLLVLHMYIISSKGVKQYNCVLTLGRHIYRRARASLSDFELTDMLRRGGSSRVTACASAPPAHGTDSGRPVGSPRFRVGRRSSTHGPTTSRDSSRTLMRPKAAPSSPLLSGEQRVQWLGLGLGPGLR